MLNKAVIVLSAAIFVAVFAAPAMAAQYCARYADGGTNCGFNSLQQCVATVSGTGGFCARSG
jgi:hypothetical protein